MRLKDQEKVKNFLSTLKFENTRKTYLKALRCFTRFLEEEDIEKVLEKVKEKPDHFLEIFYKKMVEKGLAPKSIASWISAVKRFLKFCGIIASFRPNLKANVKFVDELPSDEFIQEILRITDKRNKAILLLLLNGISISEILDLKVKNFKKNKVYRIEINNKTYFLTNEAGKALEDYLKIRKEFGHEINEDSFLIATMDNRKMSYQTLQYSISKTIKGRVEKIGKRYKLRPLTFRKIFLRKISETKIPKEYVEFIRGKRTLDRAKIEHIKNIFVEEMEKLTYLRDSSN